MKKQSGAFMALGVLGLYYLFKNRSQVQRVLESYGIRTPLATGSVGDTIRSGLAKVTGKAENLGSSVSSSISSIDESSSLKAV